MGGGNKNPNLAEYLDNGLNTLNFRLVDVHGNKLNLRYRICNDQFEIVNVRVQNSGIE